MPSFLPVTRPEVETVAMFSFDELHSRLLFCTVLGEMVGFNCSVVDVTIASTCLGWLKLRLLTRACLETTTSHGAETLLPFASTPRQVIVTVPSFLPVTRPEVETVAIFSFDELHSRLLFCTVLGEMVGFNCSVGDVPIASTCLGWLKLRLVMIQYTPPLKYRFQPCERYCERVFPGTNNLQVEDMS